MTITGPDFISLQVRDLQRSSDFYENQLGLNRAPASPPGAIVFATRPVAFAVRTALFDLETVQPRVGAGVALWLLGEGIQQLHDDLASAGVPILAAPAPTPFGLAFSFSDPDGYIITVHDQA